MSKPRVIKDFDKLPEEVVEQLKLVFPKGFSENLVEFKNKDGETKKALPFETEDYYYLIRMSISEAIEIIEEDDDYDDYGELREDIKEDYEEKHEDNEWLEELNSNEDNDFDD